MNLYTCFIDFAGSQACYSSTTTHYDHMIDPDLILHLISQDCRHTLDKVDRLVVPIIAINRSQPGDRSIR